MLNPSADADLRSRQWAYIARLLLEKHCPFALPTHKGDKEHYPKKYYGSSRVCRIALESIFEAYALQHETIEQDSLEKDRLEQLSQTLGEFGLDRDEEIIDKLNEIGGCN